MKDKEYREANKEKIAENKKEYRAEKIHCECGSSICKDKLSRHKKSQKHINFLKQD